MDGLSFIAEKEADSELASIPVVVTPQPREADCTRSLLATFCPNH